MVSAVTERYKAKHPYIPNPRIYVKDKRKVKKEVCSNQYYYIENGVKVRCEKNGYKKRELLSNDLVKNKNRQWTNSDLIELVGLKNSGLYKDIDIALALERPISAIRNKYYTLKKENKIEEYLEKFKKGGI